MPSPRSWRAQLSSWQSPPVQPASQAGPQIADKRDCGCHLDVAVFGHDRIWCTNPAAGGDDA